MLGFVVGAAAVGVVAIRRRNKAKAREEQAARENYVRSVQPKREQSQPTVYYVRSSAYDRKVEFYDAYRAVDSAIARIIRQGSGGISCLIGTMAYYRIKEDYYGADALTMLKKVRNYRNKLSHDKRRWQYIDEPERDWVDFLWAVNRWVGDRINYFAPKLYKTKQHYDANRR